MIKLIQALQDAFFSTYLEAPSELLVSTEFIEDLRQLEGYQVGSDYPPVQQTYNGMLVTEVEYPCIGVR